MEFSSGWGVGPAFDGREPVVEISGSVPTARDAQQVAELLFGAGWRVRKQSWTEFEAEHTYARLSVLPLDPVVFTGEIAIDGITAFVETFGRTGHRCTIELYDPDSGELLIERPVRPVGRGPGC
ncbi:hypothetical protein ATKI12_7179 [Kitasatospora sp. Ki12]|uniref:hypothetical protein n=1 Tax=Kitasatospora xanthocidica TaxID=83382 RepID=UPI0016775D20|nr:hypothetical protein [Kitasatospora xanthocidica]GHF56514.1 hypothetical protein GCM10018790_38130 [Kitasatospora xanthocidica]